MPRKQSRGTCIFCCRQMTNGGLARHFLSCSKYEEAVGSANKKTGKNQTIYHLQIRDAWQKDFWLHGEMRSSARLGDLDDYLRGIWLECCGHLSQFSIGGWRGNEIPMDISVKQVFKKGMELTHIYDFGTSSETLIKVVGERDGKPLTKRPIFLMARNELPEVSCVECEQTASWLCIECLNEYDRPGFLCDQHVEDHPHDDYGEPIPLVNSPRVGMCGYDGPAEPPY
jgi:hypothetical protein